MTDNREIAEYGSGPSRQVAAAGTSIPVEMRMTMLREALTNPDVDPAKAVAMADLMFKLEDRDRKAEFNRDLIAAKAEIGPIFKRGKNTHQGTKYAKFEDIQRVTDPVLKRHNLSLDYKIGSEGVDVVVVPVLRHDNGWIEEGLPIKGPRDKGPGRSDIQAVGSSASYLQRYAAKGTLNLRFDGEDDDGQPFRAGDPLNDRQEGLLVDAQQAADAGEYSTWFNRQTARDKAILISAGHHSRLSGAPALPGAQTVDHQTDHQRQDPPAENRQPAGKHDLRTAEGWTAQYEDDCAAAPDREALLRVQTKGKAAMARLKDADAKLHQRAIDAGTKALARLDGDDANQQEAE
jgi:hypothetical protein